LARNWGRSENKKRTSVSELSRKTRFSRMW
jgi:hypothetical protein